METKLREYIKPYRLKKESIKIVITGPESTGKSTLTKSLANHFKEPFVDEMAREYLTQLHRPYNYYDLKEIAILQLAEEEKKLKEANKYLFIDTDLLVLKIWSEFKYNACDSFILENIMKRSYNYYLLCNTDLPWLADPLRESPNIETRRELFEIYSRELKFYKKKFGLVSGTIVERTERGIKLVNDFIKQ